MSNFKRLNLFLFVVCLYGSCTLPLPELTGIDLIKWKNDKNGCAGERAAVIDDLEAQRKKLEGLTESQIVELLGRPDQNELYRRNQKFYHYFLKAGPACGQGGVKAASLSIRFNATERATEIVIE